MKNKILISFAVLLTALIIIVRVLFNQHLEVFKANISNYEVKKLEQFNTYKEIKASELLKSEPLIANLFSKYFDENKAIIVTDTTFAYLYLKKRLTYRLPSVTYLNCLYEKCSIDLKNEAANQSIVKKEAEFRQRYKATFDLWYPKIKDDKLVKRIGLPVDCKNFFPDVQEIKYDPALWNEFGKFLSAYNNRTRVIKDQNRINTSKFESQAAKNRNQLRKEYRPIFDSRIAANRDKIIGNVDLNETYESTTLGNISYTISQTQINYIEYNKITDELFEEQWKTNSLAHGSMPYAYCYGSNNSCDWGCSEIHVTSGGSDVLVTIKNDNQRVLRHGYIKAGRKMIFHVPDGRYQVFFYSGTGWNPNKVMANTNCGELRGGFVSNESFTKGQYEYLSSQILTYELIAQQNGNFNPNSSSANEAFN